MSEGLWNAGSVALEGFAQARLTRWRSLRINLDPAGALSAGDASSYGSVAPSSLAPVSDDRGLEGGPHFVLSGESPDGRPTLGFEWCLLFHNANGDSCLFQGDGFTVTIWQLIDATMTPDGRTQPQWAAFEPLADVGFRELYHSFDVNACALRFQIENYVDTPGATSISIYLAEL